LSSQSNDTDNFVLCNRKHPADVRGMIRALVFDFDGLILDTETPIIEAWAQLHAQAGIPCERREALDLIGEVDHDYDPWHAFSSDLSREVLEQEHRKLTRAIIQQQPLLPGVRERLDEARQLGLLLAVASNSSHRHVDGHLQRLGLFEYFITTRCRDDVARGKPEPDVYQAVIEALGVNAAEAIAFEDSKAGTIAAKRAGLRCVAVPNNCTRHHDFSQADLCLTSLAKLPLGELIKQWM
jgi:HAD superfamily hydrolase (TIGR01509 family)